jgi:long-chain acyl-CoA synthetase
MSTDNSLTKIVVTCALLPIFLLDIVLYILSFAWLREIVRPKIIYSVAKGTATDTHGAPRRSIKSPDVLVASVYDGGKAKTVYDMTRAAVRDYGSKPALVSRKFVELKKLKETDRFPSKVYEDFTNLDTITYEEFGEMTTNFGCGLRQIGMEPIPQLKAGQHFDDVTGSFVLCIFEDTCKQWTIALHGAFSQSITVATCYATLGEEA